MKCEACGKPATFESPVHVVSGYDDDTVDYWLVCGACIGKPEKWVPAGWPQIVDNQGHVWWTRSYPQWICSTCGAEYGKRRCGVATWHAGKCDLCGIEASVTEPRDFGHLREGWDRGLVQ